MVISLFRSFLFFHAALMAKRCARRYVQSTVLTEISTEVGACAGSQAVTCWRQQSCGFSQPSWRCHPLNTSAHCCLHI